MIIEIQILLMLGLACAAVVAAAPLLHLPQCRRVLAGIGGSGLMALGATTFGLIAGGFVAVPALSPSANAQEPVLAEADESAGKTSVEGSGASAAPSAESPAAGEPSLAPSVTIHIPAGRPSWTSAEPVITGKDIDTIPVGSSPYKRLSDARRALDRAIEAATNDYIRDHLNSKLAPQLLRFDARQIKETYVKRENLYEDTPNFPDSVGEMHECFALLEFPPAFRQQIEERWNEVRSTSRMTQLGLFAGAALLLLASVFGYFRLDNATRGYYTGRLQFLTAAAILAVIGAGVFAAQWIHWL